MVMVSMTTKSGIMLFRFISAMNKRLSEFRHYRYLGMFQNHCYHGTGIVITSTGTYCEATFAANKIVESHDTLLMDPNGRSFVGKVNGFFQLIGKVMVIMGSRDLCHMICYFCIG